MPTLLNLHSVLPRSRANGPGVRTVIWFQGCSLGCPGCFNSDTHPHSPGLLMPVNDLISSVNTDFSPVDGVTLSGGEPLEQPKGLLSLLRSLRQRTALSTILFSGFTEVEIRRIPEGAEILALVDALVSGRFVRELRNPQGLLGSANQRISLFSGRYTLAQLTAGARAEVCINADGSLVVTGLDPPSLSCSHTFQGSRLPR